jgi:hypothetical protein
MVLVGLEAGLGYLEDKDEEAWTWESSLGGHI